MHGRLPLTTLAMLGLLAALPLDATAAGGTSHGAAYTIGYIAGIIIVIVLIVRFLQARRRRR